MNLLKIKNMKRIIIIIAAVAMLAGCKTHERIVTVYQHHTDTLIKTKVQRDSIYSHDSIYIKEKGDTVWIEKWHTRWRDVIKTDTVYRNNVVTEYQDGAEETKEYIANMIEEKINSLKEA